MLRRDVKNKQRYQAKLWLLGIVTGVFCASISFVHAAENFQIYFTASSNDGVPSTDSDTLFECTQTIYTVIEAKDFDAGHYQIVVRWIDPGDKLREKTTIDFSTDGKDERVWAWLKLHRPTGAALGTLFNPAIGMGEFIGQWSVKIQINDKRQPTLNFEVLC